MIFYWPMSSPKTEALAFGKTEKQVRAEGTPDWLVPHRILREIVRPIRSWPIASHRSCWVPWWPSMNTASSP
jgi:hypothetical protein